MKATNKDKKAIVKEEEGTAAESLNKEIRNVEEESTINDDQVTALVFDDDVTPVEALAWTIGGFLADRTAERFSEMVDGKEIALIKCIVHRLEHSKPKEA